MFRSLAIVMLALWWMSTASFVYAESSTARAVLPAECVETTTGSPLIAATDMKSARSDPERVQCLRDGSSRGACRLAWVAAAQHRHIVHALGAKRIVTFYGSPLGRGLGVLGNSEPEKMLKHLRAQTEAYRKIITNTEVIPAFHMVVVVADGFAGEDKDYNHRVDPDVIRKWIDWAAEENVWVILDIQAGRGDPLAEYDRVEPFLFEPHVQIAVDPEFIVDGKNVPGQQLGKIDAAMINEIQARLDRVARSIGMTKVLIVHQFDDRMIVDKDKIGNMWTVEMVWDADGFGSPAPKIDDYNQYRAEAGFEKGGIKLFYNYDSPLMTPADVMALEPTPSVIIYQ